MPKGKRGAAVAPAKQEITYIGINQIKASPTNPRKRFDKVSLGELAGSIKSKGVLEPLLVREDGGPGLYELIAGERRWRAAKIAKLAEVPTIVRALTNDEVLDIQIHENLHREDVHPLDEAGWYKHLLENVEGMTIPELAARVGKSEAYVHQRLKLNDLVPAGIELLAEGKIPVGYALEISKYGPDQQMQIIDDFLFLPSWQGGGVQPLARVREYVRSHVLLNLANAPFSTKAKDLRPDGLSCLECPQRTGAAPTLFVPEEVGLEDCCLNPTCYREKVHEFLKKKQLKATTAAVKAGDRPADYIMPIVNGQDAKGPEDRPDVLGYSQFRRVHGKACKFAEEAVNAKAGGDFKVGATITICREPTCKQHLGAGNGTATRSQGGQLNDDQLEKERLQRRIRKEEIFDTKVAEPVRKLVLRIAAESYAGEILTDEAWSEAQHIQVRDWFGPLAMRALKGQFYMDEHTGRVIAEMFVADLPEEIGAKWDQYTDKWSFREDEYAAALEAAEPSHMYRLMFLSTHGHKGKIAFGSYVSQSEVRALAIRYEINYRLLDAQQRLRVAEEGYKKHAPLFVEYLAKVEAGEAAEIPRPYSDQWKPKDEPELEEDYYDEGPDPDEDPDPDETDAEGEDQEPGLMDDIDGDLEEIEGIAAAQTAAAEKRAKAKNARKARKDKTAKESTE